MTITLTFNQLALAGIIIYFLIGLIVARVFYKINLEKKKKVYRKAGIVKFYRYDLQEMKNEASFLFFFWLPVGTMGAMFYLFYYISLIITYAIGMPIKYFFLSICKICNYALVGGFDTTIENNKES